MIKNPDQSGMFCGM